MSGQPWRDPVWSGCEKHRPIANGPRWPLVRAGTNQGNKIAKYHEDMTLDEIEELEMSFVHPNHLINERRGVRYYFGFSSEGSIVGASYGEDTSFIVIQRHQAGHVHGYPETRQRLIDRMRKYNPELLVRFLERFPT